MKRLLTTIFLVLATLAASAQDAQTAYSLDDCLALARQNNRKLQNARLEVEAAGEERAAAFTKYFPSVSAGLTGFIAAKDLIRTEMDLSQMAAAYNPALSQMGMGIPDAMSISMLKGGAIADLAAMQPIYAGGQIVNGNRLAVLQQEVRRLQLAMTEREIAQSVTDYYWKIVSLRGSISTLAAAKEQLDGVHKYTADYVNAGVINRNALLEVEINLQENESQRLSTDNAAATLTAVLAQLIGADPKTFSIKGEVIDQPAAPDTYLVPADEAVQRREELQLAQLGADAKELQVKLERGKGLPSVAIGATGYYNYMGMGKDNPNMHNGNLVGLATVSIPITDWGGGKHNMRKARIAQQQAENDRQDAQEQLAIDVLTAWNALNEAYAQIAVMQRTVDSADENLRIYQNEYRAGTADVTDVLDAVTIYTKAHNNLNSALADYQNRISDYLRKTGR